MFDVAKLTLWQMSASWDSIEGSNIVRVVQSAQWIQRKADVFSYSSIGTVDSAKGRCVQL